MAVEPVAQPPHRAARQELRDCQRVDISNAAGIEVARACMMYGVRAMPAVMRGKGQYAEGASEPVIGCLVGEEGSVSAVVLYKEEAKEKCSGRQRKQQAQKVASLQGREHQKP